MSIQEGGRTRATNYFVQEKRATHDLARPFLDDIFEWQVQLARLRFKKTAAQSTDEDRLQARLEMGELLEAVQHRRRAFELAADGQKIRGALADLQHALARLDEQIADELRK